MEDKSAFKGGGVFSSKFSSRAQLVILLGVDVSRVPYMSVIQAFLADSLNPKCLVDARRADTPKGR